MIVYDDGRVFVVRRPIPGAVRYSIHGADEMDWPDLRSLAEGLMDLVKSEPIDVGFRKDWGMKP